MVPELHFSKCMKIKSPVIQVALIATAALLVGNGCSTLMPGQTESSKEMSAAGPTVLNPHVEPSVVELNRNLQPKTTPEILADVKDFRGRVKEVRVQFTHVPLEIPMENVGGTTW